MPAVLLTGANRGLGLGFAQVYLDAGWQVLAAVRNPAAADELRALAAGREAQLSLFPVDLSDLPSIEALGAAVGDTPIDLLLGNAAKTNNPRCGVGDTDYATWLEAFTVNTMAQMKLAETFVENVAASEHKKMFFVSSRIGAAPLPGLILFRTTKSALNQVVMQLALLLRERSIIVACGHPGFVKARSTAGMGVFEAVESAAYLKEIIDGLTLAGSGQFYEPDGSTLPIVTRQMNPNAFGAKPPEAWAAQQKVWDRQKKS